MTIHMQPRACTLPTAWKLWHTFRIISLIWLWLIHPMAMQNLQKIPSGGGRGLANGSTGTRTHFQRKNVRKPDGTWGYANWRNVGEEIRKKIVAWDVAPGEDYFKELFRVSRNQIIWGGNYFRLPPCRCFLVWRKLTISESFTMAMAEYAWTSFNANAKVYEAAPQSTAQEPRFHPTQKPVKLYQWQLSLYAKPGTKILDTHAGSASSLVACHRAGLDAWGFEIDPGYYARANERLKTERAQINIMELLKEASV